MPVEPSPGRLGLCRECGFGVAPELEFCPCCGLRQREAAGVSVWSKLVGRVSADRADTCLLDLEARAHELVTSVREEVQHFERQFALLTRRASEARHAGRVTGPLERAAQGMATALEQRRKLLAEYEITHWDLVLDRAENDLQLLGQEAAEPPGALLALMPRQDSFPTRPLGAGGLALSPDGRWLALASQDGTLALWDLTTRTETLALAQRAKGSHGLTVSGDGRRLAWLVGGMLGTSIVIHDTADQTELSLRQRGTQCAAFDPDVRLLATGLRDGEVRLWRLDATKRASAVMPGGEHGVTALAFSFDGSLLAAGDAGGAVRVWDLTGRREEVVIAGRGRAVTALAFSPADARLAVADAEGVAVCDPAGGTLLATLEAPGACLGFTPDGRWLALGADRPVEVWQLAYRALAAATAGPPAAVRALGFSLDRRTLTSAAADGTVSLWRAARVTDPFGVVRGIAEQALAMLSGDALTTVTKETPRIRRRTEALLATASQTLALVFHGRLTALAASSLGEAAVEAAGEARRILAEITQALTVFRQDAAIAALPGAFQEFLDELPARALATLLDDGLATVQRQLDELQRADEAECTRRLAVLTDQQRRSDEFLVQLDILPPNSRDRATARALRTAVEGLRERLPAIEDIVLARQSLAALGSIAPLADKPQVAALEQLRADLRRALTATPAAVAAPGLEAVGLSTAGLNDRDLALRAVQDEYQRIRADSARIVDVDELLA